MIYGSLRKGGPCPDFIVPCPFPTFSPHPTPKMCALLAFFHLPPLFPLPILFLCIHT
jgi:hypothetical protein